MALMRTMIKPNMVNGIRCYDPVFKQTAKQNKPTIYNFTTDKVYREMLTDFGKPPRMHSYFIPKWKQIKEWQAEAALDVGLPSYKRFPLSRTIYRFAWAMTIINFIFGEYYGYVLIKNANDGMAKPPFLF